MIDYSFTVLKGSEFAGDLEKLLDSEGLRSLGEEFFFQDAFVTAHMCIKLA